MENYEVCVGYAIPGVNWKNLCECDESLNLNENEIEPLEDEYCRYAPYEMTPSNAKEVEEINRMQFDANASLAEPSDLFVRPNGTTGPQIRRQYRATFMHSASSSFFMYIPIAFWKVVTHATNVKAQHRKAPKIELDEMMRFFGILFYMSLVDRGGYTNYWGEQIEDSVLGRTSVSSDLSSIMKLKRFQFIRENLSFRHDVSANDVKKDPAARIRPLLTLLKIRCPAFVDVGRNVAVDESSIACRSKFARHLIMYNPTKPTGKYHFKIYACCCSVSWIAISFKLHCQNDIQTRLEGVLAPEAMDTLQEDIQGISEMRQLMSELIEPIQNSNRIVNTDNYYTSTQLLQLFRTKGLYGRGTVRANSRHFPKCFIISKQDNCTRGEMRQAVSVRNKIVAASWVDGNIVNIISNADASTTTTVERQVRKRKVSSCSCSLSCNLRSELWQRFVLHSRFHFQPPLVF
jgi:hypothetical protein